MVNRLLSVWPAIVLLIAFTPGLVEAQSAASASLRIEELTARPLANDEAREINVSFRIVNRGITHSSPARATVVPGVAGGRGLESFGLAIPELAAGQTLYVSRTVELPAGAPSEIRVQLDALVTGAGKPLNVVATIPFLNKPSPGEWVSIGPRRITAPGIPAFGLGQYDATGRLTSVAVHPTNPKIIYAASIGELGHEGCGVWKTTNGGISWQPVTESLPTLAVGAIALDPILPDRVYIATADNGIFRSEDGGISWLNIATQDLNVQRNTGKGDPTVLLIDPVDTSVLYLTTEDGVRRSIDGGSTWPISLSGDATSLVIDPYNHHVLYAGIQENGVYKGVFDPVQQVVVWSQEALPISSYTPTLGILLAISRPSPALPATLYALLGTPVAGLKGWSLFTKAEGASWIARNRCAVAGTRDTCARNILAVDPQNPQTVYLAGPQLSMSINGGVNFTDIPTPGKEDRQPDGPHGDYHGWMFDPSHSGIVYAATDGGIYRSTDHGKEGSWAFIGEGITNAEMYDIAGAATPPRRLFAGTQDNGTMLYSGSVIWDHIFPAQPTALAPCAGCGGDGALVDIDIAHPDTFYLMVQLQDSLIQTPDVGVTFFGFAGGLPSSMTTGCGAFNSRFHFEVHPTTPTTLLASCLSLWRTTTNVPPGNWQSIFSIPSGTAGIIARSAVDPSIDLYYAATGRDGVGAGGGAVYAGPGGANFVEIFRHPQGESISDLELDPERPATLYASFAQSYQLDRDCATLTTGRILQLTRLSAAPTSQSMRVVDITGDLRPGLCVNTLAVDPNGPLTVYAGTQKGVYRGRPPARLIRGGTWSWTPYNHNLPLADVRDLEFHPSVRIMFAATYGRGAFEMFTPASKVRK